MGRTIVYSLILSLILSLAAPAGAVFAMTDLPDETEGLVEIADAVEGVAAVSGDLAEPGGEISTEGGSDLDLQIDSPAPAEPVSQPEPIIDMPPETPVINESDSTNQVAAANGVVITELQTRGVAGATSELVELFNASDNEVDVTGWCIQRASATGLGFSNVTCFNPGDGLAATRLIMPAGSYAVLASDSLILANPGFNYDLRFSGGMADTGGRIRLVDARGGVVDLLGWGGASEYLGSRAAPAITSSQPVRSLHRVVNAGQYQNARDNYRDFILDIAGNSYQAGALYEVTDLCLNVAGIQSVIPEELWQIASGECVDKISINFCPSLMINEVAANTTRQYIELVNSSTVDLDVSGCRLMTNRSSSLSAELPDLVIEPGGFLVIYIDDTELKLTKSTSGTVYLLASDTVTELDQVFYEDLSTDTSWSRFGAEWKQTYSLTPLAQNQHAQYPPCGDGYWRNELTSRCNKIAPPTVLAACRDDQYRSEETGRCRNVTTSRQLTPCREGQYRSEETNRCRSIASAVSTLKPCADDQFRNPLTNRCKKIASSDDVALADCGEGRERNPQTNRCRNILSSAMPTAPFAPEKVAYTAEGLWGWWAFGGVSLLALGYAGWQWRFELGRAANGALRFFASRGKGGM